MTVNPQLLGRGNATPYWVREEELQLHPLRRCAYCGDRMFWEEGWDRWVCMSWLRMEGGCPLEDPVDKEE